MKLKSFTPQNCIAVRSKHSVPSIHLNVNVGRFVINHNACELIGIKDDDQILFHQDEDEPENWYIEKVPANGFVLRYKKKSGNGLAFNNSALARQIAESVAFSETSGKCLIAGLPTIVEKNKLFGLLTKTLRKN